GGGTGGSGARVMASHGARGCRIARRTSCRTVTTSAGLCGRSGSRKPGHGGPGRRRWPPASPSTSGRSANGSLTPPNPVCPCRPPPGIGTPRAILLLDNLHRWPVAVGLCAQLFHDGAFQRRASPFRVAFSYSSADPNGFRQAEVAIEGLVNKFESTYLLHEPLTRLPTPRADPLPYFHLLYHHDPPRTFAPGVDDEDKNT